MRQYVLDELGRPVPCLDLLEWAEWFDDPDNRIIAATYFGDGAIHVSTVFLGLDHQWGDGPPVLWETMIFAKEGVMLKGLDTYQERYTSLEDAKQGHAAACTHVQGLIDAHRRQAMGIE